MEGAYLKDTQPVGNVIVGFDGFYGPRSDRRRRCTNMEQDRIFSSSSATYQKSIELKMDNSKITRKRKTRNRSVKNRD